MAFHPYLFFSRTCREAFTRYHEIFGGELTLLPMSDASTEEPSPADQADLIMHEALKIDGDILIGSDDASGDGGPMRGVAINYTTTDPSRATRVFEALADGGEVTVPLAPTFWAPMFGMCVDRFGVPWMVNVEAEAT